MRHSTALIPALDPLIEELKSYGAERIILFGSLARGDADADSDADLVVVKRTTMNFVDRLADIVRKCPSTLKATCNVDIIVYTPEEFHRMQEAENPFLEDVLRDGKLLYEKAQAAG